MISLKKATPILLWVERKNGPKALHGHPPFDEKLENGRAIANRVAAEVNAMLSTAWLMLGAMMYSLQLNTGSFPRPLSEKEEQHYISMAKEGDLEARNILIERNLRLVAHIMKKY